MAIAPNQQQALAMRPVYRWLNEGTPEEFVQRLQQLVSFDPAVDIQCGSHHAILSVPVEARHYWSPILDIQVQERDGATYVHARMGPEPSVWTLFVFLYAATGFPCVLGTVYGLAQMAIGGTSWGLAIIPLSFTAWGLIYAATFVGKGLGADQIHRLLAVLEANLGVDVQSLD